MLKCWYSISHDGFIQEYTMKLYYVPGVCSLASHIALREAGLAFALDKMDCTTRRTACGESYLEANPKLPSEWRVVAPGTGTPSAPHARNCDPRIRPAVPAAANNGLPARNRRNFRRLDDSVGCVFMGGGDDRSRRVAMGWVRFRTRKGQTQTGSAWGLGVSRTKSHAQSAHSPFR